jgi:CoA-transferase family III
MRAAALRSSVQIRCSQRGAIRRGIFHRSDGPGGGVAAIWKERTGAGQSFSIDMRGAAHGINPELTFHPTVNSHPYPNWLGNMHAFTVFPYRTKDGRWVYPSGVYPHQHFAWSNFFSCGVNHAGIGAAIAKWDAAEPEDTTNAKGHTLCVARSPEEWLAHPQGSYLANEPVIAVSKIGAGPAVPFAPAKRPLEGIRVLSLTHAIAGPVVGRTLAEQGADVLCVNRRQRRGALDVSRSQRPAAE